MKDNIHNITESTGGAQVAKLRYDGRYDWIPGESRQWTILNDFFDQNGANRRKGSFSLQGLKEIGVIK